MRDGLDYMLDQDQFAHLENGFTPGAESMEGRSEDHSVKLKFTPDTSEIGGVKDEIEAPVESGQVSERSDYTI